MIALRPSGFALAMLLAHGSVARAEGPTIEHAAIKCLVAGKYRKMPARFAPVEVAQPRVYFRPEGVPSWYYVEMKPEEPLGHVGVLPKPTKKLVGQHIEYYLEAASRDFDTGRTPEYDPIVVAKDSECSHDPVVALYSDSPPSGVFPSVPQGFAIGGGIAGGTLAAVVGGGAAAGGAALLLTRDDEATTTTTTTVTTSTTTTITTTTTTTTMPSGLACQADPRQGSAPLRVKFTAQAGGGTGVFDYVWDFGDGGTSTQVSPSHVYDRPGVYEARVRAVSADRSETCSRTVTVLANAFRLNVNPAGSGTGRITGDGIDCPGDCSEEYAAGTAVALVAEAMGGSTFTGWGGDCSGNLDCTVTMDQERSVTATFALATFDLNVTVGGTGSGTVSGGGISCLGGGGCSQTYPAGTAVTLTAAPAGGSTVVWGGDCVGNTGLTCGLIMSAPRNVSVTFNAALTFRLTLTVNGFNGATGGVSVTPSSIRVCGSAPAPPGNTCTVDYAPGEPVVLDANADNGFFSGYGGDCSVKGNTCNLVMSQDRTVTADFDQGVLPPTPGPASLASRFEMPGARGQVLLNGVLLPPPGSGDSTWTVSVVDGENRLEAQILDAGRGGTWRFDLSGIPGIERGSLRVLTGQAIAVGPDSIVFRLAGRAGERIGLAFTKR